MVLFAVALGGLLAETVLALEPDGAVRHEVTQAGVAGGEHGKTDDDALKMTVLVSCSRLHGRCEGWCSPSGINSAGIDLMRDPRRCETV